MSRRELMGKDRADRGEDCNSETFINSSTLKITHKSTIGFIIHSLNKKENSLICHKYYPN
jgi:hypothetical protein